ncbi:MAG: hypothetical protein K5839_02440 [Treponemataceae bacterium]|nr:hypothetical protein [Treponemataceae bacterium]
MSIPLMCEKKTLTDFVVRRDAQCCIPPAIFYKIWRKEDLEKSGKDNCVDKATPFAEFSVPGLALDEFSLVLYHLSTNCIDKISDKFGSEITERFFSDFMAAFFPEKKDDYCVRFLSSEKFGSIAVIDILTEKYHALGGKTETTPIEDLISWRLFYKWRAENPEEYEEFHKKHRRTGGLREYLENNEE